MLRAYLCRYSFFSCFPSAVAPNAVLCCAVLCCAVLYCTVLYCTVLYCTVLYCAAIQVMDEVRTKDAAIAEKELEGKTLAAQVGRNYIFDR